MFYFEDARREIVSYEIDETPAKINTWERLNRLSRKLAIETDTANRCTEAHFEALLNKIREQYAKDYNYPHKLTSIRCLFFSSTVIAAMNWYCKHSKLSWRPIHLKICGYNWKMCCLMV